MGKGKSKKKSKAPVRDELVDWVELVEGKELERAARALWGYVKDSEFGQELGPAKVADLAYGVLWAAGATPHHRKVARRDQEEAVRRGVLATLGVDPEEYSPEMFGEVLAEHRRAVEWKRSVEAAIRGPARPDNVAQGGIIGDLQAAIIRGDIEAARRFDAATIYGDVQAARRLVRSDPPTYEYRMKNPEPGMASYVLSAYMQEQGWVIERRPSGPGHGGWVDETTPWERILP